MHPPYPLICTILLYLGFTTSTTFSSEEERSRQTQFFVPHDVNKILSEGIPSLREKGVTSFKFQSYFCSWNEERQEHSCVDHTAPLVQLEQVSNEHDFLYVLKEFCTEVIEKLSQSGTAYQGGFTSIIDCMYYEQESILTSMVASEQGIAALNEQYHPIIEGLPPNPGCEVNWMWHLASLEMLQPETADVLLPIFVVLDSSSGGSSSNYFVEIRRDTTAGLPIGTRTQILREDGWHGLLIASTPNDVVSGPLVHTHFVTPNNVVEIFDEHRVPLEPDYVAIDISSVDVWVARSLLGSKYRPRVVSVAYNSNFPIAASVTMPADSDNTSDTNWNLFDLFWGASAGSIRLMAEEMGYSVVHFAGTESVILIRSDLLGDDCPPPYAQFSNRIKHKHSCVLDPHRQGKWVEYATYRDGVLGNTGQEGQLERSRLAAREQALLMTGFQRGSASSVACLGLV